ncbi:hypothetical protein CXG81DRAFT_19133 [Caulochytrium protostelioides]|uniref:Uncharacterized protein n=1 Tax=Caulochytrium protostelioides TaxID=1555241 RepID=A0A4P9WP38_9FUNG|nr:hypothetical protein CAUPRSCDRAFT_9587 [Caulochytrium protostelioides]RKP01034.1 hypothetical protein CXG81DRAFT_19133 [Caulochytrium protostelioides]|eukprot:RKP01034.1 hypothetical protein CXG81DRAFT_19133 [Caulochytrium protostelioides]
MTSLTQKAQDTAAAIAARLDPYTPAVVKNAATFAGGVAFAAADTANRTVQNTVSGVHSTVSGTRSFVDSKVSQTVDLGRYVFTRTTTTLTAYTPGPILALISGTIAGAQQLKADPVSTIKGHSPAFVVHAGEKTFEVIHHAGERAQVRASATTGYIVTKVNGVVTHVAEIPAVHTLIEQLNKLALPVLVKLGYAAAPQKEDEVVEGEVTTDDEAAAPAVASS